MMRIKLQPLAFLLCFVLACCITISMDFSSNTLDVSAASYSATSLPEVGLPTGRGTTISSSSNVTQATAHSVNTLKSYEIYNGSVSSSDTQDYYRFDFSKQETFNTLLSGLSSKVGIQLLDSDGHAIADASSNSDSAAAISTALNPGTYYVRVYSLTGDATNYHLSLVNGAAYYVASSGSDSNSGAFNSPFRTIQHAADAAQAGTTILVRGGTYYEREINLRNSGTADRPISFVAAPGETAIIDHGLQVPSWSSAGNGVYVGTPILPDATLDRSENTVRVVVDNQALMEVSQQSDLTEGTFWQDTQSGKLYVWAKGGVDPGSKETIVINRRSGRGRYDHYGGISLQPGANNIGIDGFSIRAADTGIWAVTYAGTPTGSNLTVRNTEIKFCWDAAIRLDNWDGASLHNNNIHNNAQISLPNRKDWPHAILGFNSHNVTVSSSRIHNNGGEGVGPFKGSDRWYILNNVVHDNWSVNIYIDTELGDVTVDGNFVYNTHSSTEDNNGKDGIRIGNEAYDSDHEGKPGVENITITNNVVVNTGGGIRFFPYYDGGSYLTNSVIANNTIAHTSGGREGILIRRGDNVRVTNNVVYPSAIVLEDGFNSGIVAENNQVSDGSLKLGGGVQSQNNDLSDPQFTTGSGLDPTNYRLKDSSGVGAAIETRD